MGELNYFKQRGKYNCSLAVLRMVLDYFGVIITEEELQKKVEKNYGVGYKNLWNPTIAKLAMELGVKTEMYALWSIFKKRVYRQAIKEYEKNSNLFDYRKYENKSTKDNLSESLFIAYREMFEAVKLGCKVHYGSLTVKRINFFLKNNFLIQTSVRLNKLYTGKKTVFHSILIYYLEGDKVFFHDPAHGEGLSCSINHLIKATQDVGVFMLYKKK